MDTNGCVLDVLDSAVHIRDFHEETIGHMPQYDAIMTIVDKIEYYDRSNVLGCRVWMWFYLRALRSLTSITEVADEDHLCFSKHYLKVLSLLQVTCPDFERVETCASCSVAVIRNAISHERCKEAAEADSTTSSRLDDIE